MTTPRRILLPSLVLVPLAGLALLLWPQERLDTTALLPKTQHQVRILRDSWGVPHVFGHTDADVAYGLAYAHAEDDFATIQGALLATRGRLASVYGRQAAPNDYMVGLLRVRDFVEARYATDLSPETRALCEAYAEGINRYAALHPDKALVPLYPARGRDVAAGFLHKMPLFFGLDRVLKGILEPEAPPAPSVPTGSNTFVVGPSRSADGATRLLVNSHQPWEGPVAWYEAHLHSDAGWDMVGGVFPGAPIVLHGHNRDLGWAHTVNRPDLIDVYALTLNPADPNEYRYDGEWRKLETRDVAIDVKLVGPLHWTAHREVLWSVYGPTVRGPKGTFAIRYSGLGDLRPVEQWYRMNRARSFEEWRDAMRLEAVPMFNTAYADKAGNIFYVYNARLPVRAPGYDWRGVVPGDTSRTLWTDFVPFEALPQVKNPPSGFIQNCNSSPFRTTLGPGNPEPAADSERLGIETTMTNRSLRALELLGGDSSITRREFLDYKFDVTYSRDSAVAAELARLLAAPPPADPKLREALEWLRGWDLSADGENPRAALALLTLRPSDDNAAGATPLPALLERLGAAARSLESHFGRIDVQWQYVVRLRRGHVDLGLSGGPDLLHAVYGHPGSDGRIVGMVGDSYVLVAEWDREGRVSSRSIHQYGSATLDVASPHYADQAALFAGLELKPVWLDEADVRAHLEREYRPGE
jgi:penicillin amidase/acyl-homoserine-lactone acylase